LDKSFSSSLQNWNAGHCIPLKFWYSQALSHGRDYTSRQTENAALLPSPAMRSTMPGGFFRPPLHDPFHYEKNMIPIRRLCAFGNSPVLILA
jgi:hypothetical protein